MRTTEQTRKSVRRAAIGVTVVAALGLGVAFGADPYPTSQPQNTPQVLALQKRERTLARESGVINTMNARRWAEYRVALRQRQQEIVVVQAENARSARAAASQAAAVQSSSSSSSSGSGSQVTYVQSAPAARSSAS